VVVVVVTAEVVDVLSTTGTGVGRPVVLATTPDTVMGLPSMVVASL